MKSSDIYGDRNLYQIVDRQRDYKRHLRRIQDIQQRSVRTRENQYFLNEEILFKTYVRKENSSRFLAQEQTFKMQKENDLLLQKLIEISSRPNSVSPTTQYLDTSMCHKYLKFKQNQDSQIIEQNEKFNKRLIQQQATFSSKQFEDEFNQHQEYMMRIIRYKVNPKNKQVEVSAMNFHNDYMQGKAKLPNLSTSNEAKETKLKTTRNFRYVRQNVHGSNNSSLDNKPITKYEKLEKIYARKNKYPITKYASKLKQLENYAQSSEKIPTPKKEQLAPNHEQTQQTYSDDQQRNMLMTEYKLNSETDVQDKHINVEKEKSQDKIILEPLPPKSILKPLEPISKKPIKESGTSRSRDTQQIDRNKIKSNSFNKSKISKRLSQIQSKQQEEELAKAKSNPILDQQNLELKEDKFSNAQIQLKQQEQIIDTQQQNEDLNSEEFTPQIKQYSQPRSNQSKLTENNDNKQSIQQISPNEEEDEEKKPKNQKQSPSHNQQQSYQQNTPKQHLQSSIQQQSLEQGQSETIQSKENNNLNFDKEPIQTKQSQKTGKNSNPDKFVTQKSLTGKQVSQQKSEKSQIKNSVGSEEQIIQKQNEGSQKSKNKRTQQSKASVNSQRGISQLHSEEEEKKQIQQQNSRNVSMQTVQEGQIDSQQNH